MGKRRPKTDQAYQFRMVELYLKSGQTQKVFSEEHDLSIHSLQRWVYLYRKHHSSKSESSSSSGTNFVPVNIEQIPHHFSSDRIEIHYPNGTKLFLPLATDPLLIKSLTA